MQAILTPTMQPQAVVSLRYPVRPDLEAWVLPEGKVPESTTHFMTVHRMVVTREQLSFYFAGNDSADPDRCYLVQ